MPRGWPRGLWQAIAVLWTLLIATLSCLPGSDLPTGPVVGADKVVHLGLYAVLAFSWVRALPVGLKVGRLVAICVVLVGGLDEWHQAFVPGRHASAMDLVADAVGAWLGSVYGSRD